MISLRAARLHPERRGGKEKRKGGQMATDDVINSPTRSEKESECNDSGLHLFQVDSREIRGRLQGDYNILIISLISSTIAEKS